MEHWDTIAAERLALADDLDGLTDEQWRTPSLCGDWTVREVLGHLVMSHKTSLPRFGLAVLRARGSFDTANSRLSVREGQRPPAELIADLRRFAESHFKAPGFGSEAPLTDILLHSFDIRIPLGLPTARPAEPYRYALDLLVTKRAERGFVPRGRPAVRAVATDVDWEHGAGPEVRGTAADLALALSGRGPRVDALSGPGQPALAAWLTKR
jgi:uncharacterized protein (TIGR03083 family)